MELVNLMFNFIQNMIAICLIQGTQEFQHVWKSSMKAEKYSIKMHIIHSLFLCIQ